MTAALDTLGETIRATLGTFGVTSKVSFDELTLHVPRERIVEVITHLRDDPGCQFAILIDICGVDYPERVERFDVVYHLLSPRLNQRVRVKIATDEDTPVASLVGVFPAANWFEREAYDITASCFRATRTCAAC